MLRQCMTPNTTPLSDLDDELNEVLDDDFDEEPPFKDPFERNVDDVHLSPYFYEPSCHVIRERERKKR